MRHQERVLVAAMVFAAPMTSAQTTEIIDFAGDGMGNTLDSPRSIVVDPGGTAFVPGGGTDNSFRVTLNGAITEIIDASGDGSGNTLDRPRAIAL